MELLGLRFSIHAAGIRKVAAALPPGRRFTSLR
jgi:hypothetical protein